MSSRGYKHILIFQKTMCTFWEVLAFTTRNKVTGNFKFIIPTLASRTLGGSYLYLKIKCGFYFPIQVYYLKITYKKIHKTLIFMYLFLDMPIKWTNFKHFLVLIRTFSGLVQPDYKDEGFENETPVVVIIK